MIVVDPGFLYQVTGIAVADRADKHIPGAPLFVAHLQQDIAFVGAVEHAGEVITRMDIDAIDRGDDLPRLHQALCVIGRTVRKDVVYL